MNRNSSFRPIFKDGKTRVPVIWQITLNNTNGLPANFVIFDGLGLVADQLKVASVVPGVTVSGTFGSSTLSQLQTITKDKAVRLKEIWLQSATTGGVLNEAFFNSGYIKQCYASIAANTVVNDLIPVVNQVHQNTYQTSIREMKGFKILIDNLTGFELLLPALTQITIAFYIVSSEGTYNMNKI